MAQVGVAVVAVGVMRLDTSRRFLQGAAYAEVEIFTYPRAFGLSVKI